jgi:type VI secretion system protein ImpK
MTIQQETQDRPAKESKQVRTRSDGSGNLALLYEGLLTGIVRLQSQRQRIPDAESFRRRTKATLQEVERVAISAGYDGRDLKETHFAVVAFLDSVVLHSNEPARAEWERKTLQEEMFGQSDAGVVFFEKLEHFRSRRDSEQLADILEVYLLCLLLGFEGRYSGGLRGELESTIEKVRRRIVDIRGRPHQLSPSANLPPQVAPVKPPAPAPRPNRFRFLAVAAVIFTILLFLALKLDLVWTSEQLLGRLSW